MSTIAEILSIILALVFLFSGAHKFSGSKFAAAAPEHFQIHPSTYRLAGILELLGALGLAKRLTHRPSQLSGGEQQRVAVARAFVGRPKLMLADEPTGNLDGTTGKQVMDLLFELARADGTTLILITHDMGLAERCDRVLRIADGLLVADERMRAVLAAQ